MTSNASISSKGFACRFLRKSLGIVPEGESLSEAIGKAAEAPKTEGSAGKEKADQVKTT